MTAKDHNKTLGILFLVYCGLQAFGLILSVVMFGGMGAALLTSAKHDERTGGAIFLVMAVVVGVVSLLILIPTFLAGLKLLKAKPSARIWGIVAAILALLSFPFGTALGVYALWFLFGEKGKAFYSGAYGGNVFNQPPPPPNSWR